MVDLPCFIGVSLMRTQTQRRHRMSMKAEANERFVRMYQQREGLLVDGWAGAETVRSLGIGSASRLTERAVLEILHHEAIVQEAYKDSVGVWTWGVGVTSASGHSVERYKDNPQTIQRCIEVYAWLLREKYLPDVLEAFSGWDLTEYQLAGALSFHYNTGAIKRAEWVRSWMRGEFMKAASEFMNWRKPPEIIPRRNAEQELFFHGKWSNKGTALVYPVRKPSYQPDFRNARRVDVRADVARALE